MSQAIPVENIDQRFRLTTPGHDIWLIGVVIFLLSFGALMVASASVPIADRYGRNELYFFWRQLAAVGLGGVAALVVMRIPLVLWQKNKLTIVVLRDCATGGGFGAGIRPGGEWLLTLESIWA